MNTSSEALRLFAELHACAVAAGQRNIGPAFQEYCKKAGERLYRLLNISGLGDYTSPQEGHDTDRHCIEQTLRVFLNQRLPAGQYYLVCSKEEIAERLYELYAVLRAVGNGDTADPLEFGALSTCQVFERMLKPYTERVLEEKQQQTDKPKHSLKVIQGGR